MSLMRMNLLVVVLTELLGFGMKAYYYKMKLKDMTVGAGRLVQ